MKTKHGIFFGFVVLLVTAIFTIAGCDNDTTSNGPKTDTYTGIADSKTYTLKITDGATYELTVGSKTSTGTVSGNSPTYTLQPSTAGAGTFTVTVSGNSITAMSGTITFNDSTTETAPANVTPPQPGTGGDLSAYAGTWKNDSLEIIVAADSTFLEKMVYSRVLTEILKGTLSVNGTTLTLTFTDGWDSENEVWSTNPTIIKEWHELNSLTITGTITGSSPGSTMTFPSSNYESPVLTKE